MAQAPIMPVFTDALIGDTTHLSTEQFGAYVLILIATWRNNGRALPDDDGQLANVCRVGVVKWRRKLRPVLQNFFNINDTGWHQQRLEKEWNRVAERLGKQRASASAGGRASATAKRPTVRSATHKEATLPLKDSESLSDSESLNAAREAEKNDGGNPLGAQSAPLRPLPLAASPKTPALKAKIRAQLAWKHCRFLRERGAPGEWEAYFAQLGPESVPPQELFDATDRRMRAARWDDMRAWKRQHGSAA